MNNILIDEVSSFRDEVLKSVSNRNVVKFSIRNIDFDTQPTVDDAYLTNAAIRKILSSLRVKDNFLQYKEKMIPEEWQNVKESLKHANKDLEFYGRKFLDSNDQYIINKLYPKGQLDDEDNNLVTTKYQDFFDMVILSLEGTNKDFELKNKDFNIDKEEVLLRFLDINSEIDPFNNKSDSSIQVPDLWKRGSDLTFNALQYNSAPFIERLICTNGMVAEQYGYKTNIRNKTFNNSNIQKDINRILMKEDNKYKQILIEAANHMKMNDISLHEFYKYRGFFEEKNIDGKYNYILSNIMNDDAIFNAYGTNVKEKSARWLQTATSGRNAYDFFNDLTWLSSHPSESRMDEEDCRDLELQVSHLFFKERFDLEDIAPKVNLSVGKMITHNN